MNTKKRKMSRMYLSCFLSCVKKPHAFVQSAIQFPLKYIVLHFVLMVSLLFFPIFFIMVMLEPLIVYERFYGIDASQGQVVNRSDQRFSADDLIIENNPQIIIYQDVVIFKMQEFGDSASIEWFGDDISNRSFSELFNQLAGYNHYYTKVLLPLIWFLYFVVTIMVLLFIMAACFSLKIQRKFSSPFSFSQSFKIITLSASFPAFLGAIFGFFLPAVHIILFQLLHLVLVFWISRKYDQQEKELLLCEVQTD